MAHGPWPSDGWWGFLSDAGQDETQDSLAAVRAQMMMVMMAAVSPSGGCWLLRAPHVAAPE
ncbi:predicted protein [Pyrenophora tritici-repentis Pt-1C-BFP]|uniref:Uncharacterized protein n=1 Tax=Pyrenophora tritici-repentis (strain Pt-1C-BFP) TaxID=426418 RepID=B2VZG6_PYRTR|nr:uncharacterized protein PTRG_02806 [Pyrenophora tritici-repentis Pt-1C-BFP]EDU45329.1 predicted protein [Pyrenophora tritici-repentis Pt-1C-BFP]